MEKTKKLLSNILGYGFILFVVLALILLFIFVFQGLFSLLGCKYTSLLSLFLYFILVMIISFPMELLSKGFPKALLELERINLKTAKLLYFILDTIASLLCMIFVDYLIEAVYMSDIALLILSVILSIITNSDLKKDNNYSI